MSEERLQEIKDSINFQREILKAHNMETLSVNEEEELIEEIERLNNIIKEALRKLRATKDHYKIEDINNAIIYTIRILERSDKE